jgi:hypothetical protein
MVPIRRALGLLAAVLFGTFMVTLGPGHPANAAWSDCNSANICIFNGGSGTGTMYQWSTGYIYQRPGHQMNLTGGQNNMASSVYMNAASSNAWYVYDYQCDQLHIPGGSAMRLNNGGSYNLTSGTWSYMNNRISCIKAN